MEVLETWAATQNSVLVLEQTLRENIPQLDQLEWFNVERKKRWNLSHVLASFKFITPKIINLVNQSLEHSPIIKNLKFFFGMFSITRIQQFGLLIDHFSTLEKQSLARDGKVQPSIGFQIHSTYSLSLERCHEAMLKDSPHVM